MRSWLFGGENPGQQTGRQDNANVYGANAEDLQSQRSSSGNDGRGFMQSFQSSRGDAEMERRVSFAARNFCDTFQRIASAARKGHVDQTGNQAINPDEWKTRLLDLLGGSDFQMEDTRDGSSFVLRCVEHELPPNLIQCLRLLRVLELQNANEQHRAGAAAETIAPLGKGAAEK
eukprot:scaffold652741_cov59-Attheya_sp.AAC.1